MGLLDEVMGWASYYHTGRMAVTTKFAANFVKPVYIGQRLSAACRMISRKGSKVHMQAELRDAEGSVCSVATGTFHLLSGDKYHALIHGKSPMR